MPYTNKEILERYNQLQIKTASTASTTRDQFNVFREKLKEVPTEYLEKLGINIEEMYAEKVLPSLYKEPFDGESYEIERQEYLKLKAKIDAFIESLKEQAAKDMGLE